MSYVLTNTLAIGGGTLAIVAEEGQATLDGGGSVQLLSISRGSDVALANLVLRRGHPGIDAALPDSSGWPPWGSTDAANMLRGSTDASGEGGAIANQGNLDMQTCVFEYNEARKGGAISNHGLCTK